VFSTSHNSFVSRANPKSNEKHVILGVIGWKPRDFAAQMNLYLSNGWGIIRTIADMCLNHDIEGDDAKFVLVKDPNKPTLRLYEVPHGTLEEDGQTDNGDGDDDDVGDGEPEN
jgi:translation initiation factor 3 subunit D